MQDRKYPWSNFHGFNLDWVIETVQSCLDTVNNFATDLMNRVTKTELEIDYKLTKGNYTGKWNGVEYEEVDSRITQVENEANANSDNIMFLTNQFEEGATGAVIDCGFFGDEEINRSYDGGVF